MRAVEQLVELLGRKSAAQELYVTPAGLGKWLRSGKCPPMAERLAQELLKPQTQHFLVRTHSEQERELLRAFLDLNRFNFIVMEDLDAKN